MSNEIAARLQAYVEEFPEAQFPLMKVRRADLRALLDERDRLIHDIDRHISIASHEAERAEKAEAELARLREERKGSCPVCGCEEVDHRGLWTCRCPTPRAPVEGEAGEMVARLNAPIGLGGPFKADLPKAADLITRQSASLREAREVIERIASQNLHAEITDTDPDELDWLYAYEQCVKEARAWLAKHHGGDSEGR